MKDSMTTEVQTAEASEQGVEEVVVDCCEINMMDGEIVEPDDIVDEAIEEQFVDAQMLGDQIIDGEIVNGQFVQGQILGQGDVLEGHMVDEVDVMSEQGQDGEADGGGGGGDGAGGGGGVEEEELVTGEIITQNNMMGCEIVQGRVMDQDEIEAETLLINGEDGSGEMVMMDEAGLSEIDDNDVVIGEDIAADSGIVIMDSDAGSQELVLQEEPCNDSIGGVPEGGANEGILLPEGAQIPEVAESVSTMECDEDDRVNDDFADEKGQVKN